MRLPMSAKSGRDHTHTGSGDLQDPDLDHDTGDLIIDESVRGQVEISPVRTSSTSTYSTTPTLAPTTPSPYSEGEGQGQSQGQGHSATPTPTPSYEQLGHSFSRPSSSALSLLAANSKRQGGGGQGSSSRYAPYPRRSSSEDDPSKEEDFIPYNGNGNPSDSPMVVHSNGIWTPSCYVPTPAYENYASPQPQGQHEQGQGQGHGQSQSQHIAPTTSGGSGTAIVRGVNSSMNGGGGFLYDISNNNGNGYHSHHAHNHTHTQAHHQYKVEQENSLSPTRPSPYPIQIDGESHPVSPEGHIRKAFFTQDQVDTLCDVILRDRKRDYEMLASLLSNLSKNIHESENVLRGRAAMSFYNGDFDRLYHILGSYKYSPKHHKELQDLYQSARYAEAEKVRGRPLGAVDKYRIRRKWALPDTIWDGEATSYTFKDRDRKLLIEAYHRCGSYPNADTKRELQLITGLTKKQIENWFKNRRQRDRTPDGKTSKSKKLPHHPRDHRERDRDRDGLLVMTPVSSAGSGGSSFIYSNIPVPYHSPGEEDSMDVKYGNYANHGGNPTATPTLAQVKSYNNLALEMSHSPGAGGTAPPRKNKGGGGGKRGPAKGRALPWAKGQGQGQGGPSLGEKAGKRKQPRGKAAATSSQVNPVDASSIYSAASSMSNYVDLYSTHGNGAVTPTPRNGKGSLGSNGPGTEEDVSTSPEPHPINSGNLSQNQGPYSHHPSMGVAVGVGGWGNWPSSSSSSSGVEYHHHPLNMNMNMLPSLAASFNYHHSHSHHHAINGINPEARIQVQ